MCCSDCGCYDACCDCFCPCLSSDTRETILCCAVCLAVVAGVVLFAVLLAAYGFVRHAEVSVSEASLTRLTLLDDTAQATAFAYNLSLTLNIRNKNWAMSAKNTKPLDAEYSFDGQRFERARLAAEGEKHPPGKTRVYHLVSGADNAYVALGNAGVAEFRKQNATGRFEVEVVVSGEVKYTARYTKCKFEAKCPLKLQLAPPGTPAVVFQAVKCKLTSAEKNC